MSTEFSGNTNKPWKSSSATEVLLEYIYSQIRIVASSAPVGGSATEAKQDVMIAELMKSSDLEVSCVIDIVTDVVYYMVFDKDITSGVVTDITEVLRSSCSTNAGL